MSRLRRVERVLMLIDSRRERDAARQPRAGQLTQSLRLDFLQRRFSFVAPPAEAADKYVPARPAGQTDPHPYPRAPAARAARIIQRGSSSQPRPRFFGQPDRRCIFHRGCIEIRPAARSQTGAATEPS